MYRTLCLISLFIFSIYQLNAQIFPQEGSRVYYRIIGFSVPAQQYAAKYKVEIATGIQTTESSFVNNIITSVYSKKNKIIAEVPSFGAQYTWRAVFIASDSSRAKTIFYHFSTIMTPDVDTNITRFRIIKSAGKYKDAYVFLDGSRVLYDMKGRPVWCLPGSDLPGNKDAYPRDLKATLQGTITFMTDFQPYEINYNGKILWHINGNAANKNTAIFNHEFTRLNNGNYMTLKLGHASFPLPAFKDSVARNGADSARFYRNIQYKEIVEYAPDYHLVWHWSSLDYLKVSGLMSLIYNGNLPDNDLHENSFYFDEGNKAIYLSYRNINRIIKVKYPEGNVLNTFGPEYTKGLIENENTLFCGQHSCRASEKGYLYLFNNNTCSPSHMPTIVMIKEPAPGKNDIKKIWEYTCTVDGLDTMAKENLSFIAGGNVLELPGQSFFVSMGKPYCKVFIVGKDKKILWSAIPEKYNPATKKWGLPDGLYRASIITSRKSLEQLIWNSEKN